MYKHIVSLFVLFISSLLWGQGTIYGTITDEAGMPIEGADVYLENTDYYFYTLADGNYELSVEPGDYIVVVNSFGFEEAKGSLSIKTNELVEWNVTLVAQSENQVVQELEGIVVEADPTDEASEKALLTEQKKSGVIIEAIGSGEISRKGISDAGQAVKSIVGISKEEGSSNVYVRGLGDRYQNTTLNGLPLPSNNVEKKNIDLDIFNSNLIQQVGVSKTYNASFGGDFSAGNVNIVSKTHSGKMDIQVGLSGGFNTSVIGEGPFQRNEGTGFWGYYGRYDRNPYNVVVNHGIDAVDAGEPINVGASLSLGKSWTFDSGSKLNVLFAGSFGNNYRFEEGLEGSYAFNRDTYFPYMRRYIYNTNTTGMASIEYELNPDHTFKFLSLFINNSTDEVGYYGEDGNGFDPDLADNGGFFRLNHQFDQTRLWVNQLMGEHALTNKLNLNWGVSYNIALSDQPDRRRITLLGFGTDNVDFSFNNNFDSQRYFQNIDDKEVATRFMFEYKFDADDKLSDKLKFGYDGRFKYRDFDNIRYGLTNFNVNEIDYTNFDAIFNLDNFLLNFDNQATAPFSTFVLNPVLSSTDLGMDARFNFPGTPEVIYESHLITNAPHVSYEFRPSDKWLVIAGLRTEYFDQYINWEAINTQPGEASFKQWEFLPSLNARYKIQENVNLRLAGSRTVSIAEFKEIANFVYEDVVQSIGGNPDLINPNAITNGSTGEAYSTIWNADAKLEWFPNRGELISLAAFGKVINAPVNLVVAADAANVRRYFRTGDQAQVLGAELELEKELWTLSNGEISLGANVAYTYTQQDLFEEITGTYNTNFDRNQDELQGASPWIVNADITFQKDFGAWDTSFTLAGNYFSDRIFALGSTGRGNQIENGVPTLNLIWNNKIGKHLSANFTVRNLLNPEIKITQENTDIGEADIESYRRGVGLGLSLNYNF